MHSDITNIGLYILSSSFPRYIPRLMHSGDVHVAVYDFGNKQAYFATGTTAPNGTYTRLACDAPYIRFDLTPLWSHPAPTFP